MLELLRALRRNGGAPTGVPSRVMLPVSNCASAAMGVPGLVLPVFGPAAMVSWAGVPPPLAAATTMLPAPSPPRSTSNTFGIDGALGARGLPSSAAVKVYGGRWPDASTTMRVRCGSMAVAVSPVRVMPIGWLPGP